MINQNHPFFLKMLVLLSIIMTSSAVMAQECRPSGRITGRQPPPGKCNTENDSECCVPGQNYTTYWCSPPVTNHTEAVLNLSGFDEGQDGGGPARCDNKYHPDDTPVVALSTGWFNETSRCGDVILITGNGGRTVKAVVVDECNSYVGCDVNNDYQPPCPYNAVAASKAVWDALGVPESSPLYGVMNVTWSPTNETGDTTRAHLVHQKRHKIIIAVVVIVALLVSMIVWVVVYDKKRRRDRKNQLEEEHWENSLMFLSDAPKRFTYKELKSATDNFNEQRKLGAGGFGSVIEECCGDEEMMRNNIEEVEKMIKLAIWCLQIEPTRRPSMSTVVKVLEGAIALEPIIDSSFANSVSFSETTSGDISYMIGITPPPGQCNTENNSTCCVAGESYTTYKCSPRVRRRTKAILTLNSFEQGGDGGGPSECDGRFHSDDTLIVALSTGWYNRGSRCGRKIVIRGNGRTAKAKVVDECDSLHGCDPVHDYQPPCQNNIVDASKAVWAALDHEGWSKSHSIYG
ncbi:hypothetical protein Cgig2_031885 [Carnegiea gigantea]|uniref:Uncharacterized protein n=1 Tax=Carnegiea gigantea TaxID=171969 RepID=A0A9Q1KSS6_9CARY|nr:hypothetical protein Cgig2_031885 [Carnegiea gigantea]